jgi:uncharacterized protein (DUF433 family)
MALEQQQLIDRYIERRSGQGFADARVRGYGIDVWALVMYLHEAADEDHGVVAADYCIPPEVVAAALAYYDEHRDVINARILLNHDSMA